MSSLPFVTVDVFTTTRYAGNPLAVVRIPAEQSDKVTTAQMQTIAREFNLSETVFIHEKSPSKGDDIPEWRIRIFFPDHELPFAGHPVIGTAVYALGTLAKGAIKGRLICGAGPVELDYDPAKTLAKAGIPHNFHRHIETAFTLEQVYELQPALQSCGAKLQNIDVLSPVKGMNFVSVELADLETLAKVQVTGKKPKPTLDSEWRVGFAGSYYYVVLDRGNGADSPLRVRTRMMEGSLEDPATGSAACGLSCFLALKCKLAKETNLEITQGVEMGRQSDIKIKVVLDSEMAKIEQVHLIGSAVPVMEGSVFL